MIHIRTMVSLSQLSWFYMVLSSTILISSLCFSPMMINLRPWLVLHDLFAEDLPIPVRRWPVRPAQGYPCSLRPPPGLEHVTPVPKGAGLADPGGITWAMAWMAVGWLLIYGIYDGSMMDLWWMIDLWAIRLSPVTDVFLAKHTRHARNRSHCPILSHWRGRSSPQCGLYKLYNAIHPW